MDIICLYQLYKYKEIIKVKQINSNSNFTNLITENKVVTTLKKLINTSYLELQAIEWVKQKDI